MFQWIKNNFNLISLVYRQQRLISMLNYHMLQMYEEKQVARNDLIITLIAIVMQHKGELVIQAPFMEMSKQDAENLFLNIDTNLKDNSLILSISQDRSEETSDKEIM